MNAPDQDDSPPTNLEASPHRPEARISDARLQELERHARQAGSAAALELIAEVRRLRAELTIAKELARYFAPGGWPRL